MDKATHDENAMMAALIWMGWAAWVGISAPLTEPLQGGVYDSVSSATETREQAQDAVQSASDGLSHAAEYRGVISAYSCDQHPRNRMYPCGPFRDGTAPHRGLHGVVAACPLEWLGDSVTVEGYGVVRCVDTPRNGWYGDSPHIDLFMNFDAAIQWGIQERTVSK
jgi:hypothetical protein